MSNRKEADSPSELPGSQLEPLSAEEFDQLAQEAKRRGKRRVLTVIDSVAKSVETR